MRSQHIGEQPLIMYRPGLILLEAEGVHTGGYLAAVVSGEYRVADRHGPEIGFGRSIRRSETVALVSEIPHCDIRKILCVGHKAAHEFLLEHERLRIVYQVLGIERRRAEQPSAHPSGQHRDDQLHIPLIGHHREFEEAFDHDGLDVIFVFGEAVSGQAIFLEAAAPLSERDDRLEISPVRKAAQISDAARRQRVEVSGERFLVKVQPHIGSRLRVPEVAAEHKILHFSIFLSVYLHYYIITATPMAIEIAMIRLRKSTILRLGSVDRA